MQQTPVMPTTTPLTLALAPAIVVCILVTLAISAALVVRIIRELHTGQETECKAEIQPLTTTTTQWTVTTGLERADSSMKHSKLRQACYTPSTKIYNDSGQNTSTGAGYDQAGYNDSNTQNKAGHHGLLGKHGHHEAGSGADTQGSHGNRHTVLGPGGMTGNTSGMSSGDNYGGMTGNTSGMSSGDNYGSGTGSTGQNYGSGAEGMGRTDHNHRGNNDNLASDQGRSKSGGLFSKKSEGDGIESALERERSAQRELDAAIAK